MKVFNSLEAQNVLEIIRLTESLKKMFSIEVKKVLQIYSIYLKQKSKP